MIYYFHHYLFSIRHDTLLFVTLIFPYAADAILRYAAYFSMMFACHLMLMMPADAFDDFR